MSKDGVTGNLYEIKVLPSTVEELVIAIYDQKGKDKVSRKDAMDMAQYLDEKYDISPYVPSNKDSSKKGEE